MFGQFRSNFFWKYCDLLIGDSAKDGKLLEINCITEEFMKISSRKVNDIAIWIIIKFPAMNLPRYHKINCTWLHREFLKIDVLVTGSLSKVNQMIKGVAMRLAQMRMAGEIVPKPAC